MILGWRCLGGRGKEGEWGVEGKKGKELWPNNNLNEHNCELKAFNVEECLNISPMLVKKHYL